MPSTSNNEQNIILYKIKIHITPKGEKAMTPRKKNCAVNKKVGFRFSEPDYPIHRV